MSDDGYTWDTHMMIARGQVNYAINTFDPDERRRAIIAARASLTRAIALLPAPKDEDAE